MEDIHLYWARGFVAGAGVGIIAAAAVVALLWWLA